jgi:hypothetical protein
MAAASISVETLLQRQAGSAAAVRDRLLRRFLQLRTVVGERLLSPRIEHPYAGNACRISELMTFVSEKLAQKFKDCRHGDPRLGLGASSTEKELLVRPQSLVGPSLRQLSVIETHSNAMFVLKGTWKSTDEEPPGTAPQSGNAIQ